MKGHYLLLIVAVGKNDFDRVYVQLEHEDETISEATERWVLTHPDMINRQRNRERKANELRASILERRICRPTSWHREQAEKAGESFPRPVWKGGTRRRRAA